MIRFILDFQTTNIIVIFDSSPSIIRYVDFYYVADFLNIKKDEQDSYPPIQDIFKELLLYYKSLFEQDFEDVYIVFDLSDQYISAFHFEKFNFKGRKYLKVSLKYTQELSGNSINIDTTKEELKCKTWEIEDDFSHMISSSFIIKGLNWSIENLKINTNPVIF